VRGEGLIGLTRGFMYAGVPRLVVSLWPTDDAAAARLMIRLYEEMLKRKLRPAAALKAAMTAMYEQEASDPFVFAPFALMGEWK
jgi:CHAT domain-containing protein